MDNRINQIRKKISALRFEMLNVEAAMHDQIAHDLDCTDLTPLGSSEIPRRRRR